MLKTLTQWFSVHPKQGSSVKQHKWQAVNMPVQVKAYIDLEGEVKLLDLEATAVNLCHTGSMIRLDQELNADHLFIRFDGEEKAVKGRVVHQSTKKSTGTLIGIEFEELVDSKVFITVTRLNQMLSWV